MPRRRRKENVKAIGLDWQNNNFASASRFFCTFLCRHCTITTWKSRISRFMEDLTSLFFIWMRIWLLGIQLQKSSVAFNKVIELGNSLFKRHFRARRGHGISDS